MDTYLVFVRVGNGSSITYCDISRDQVNTIVAGLDLTKTTSVEITRWGI